MSGAKKEVKEAIELNQISPASTNTGSGAQTAAAVSTPTNVITYAESIATELGEISIYSSEIALRWTKALKWDELNNLSDEKRKKLDKHLKETGEEARAASVRQGKLSTISYLILGTAVASFATAIRQKTRLASTAHTFLDVAIVLALVFAATTAYNFYKRDSEKGIEAKLRALDLHHLYLPSPDKASETKPHKHQNILVAQTLGVLGRSPKIQTKCFGFFRAKHDAIQANPGPVLKELDAAGKAAMTSEFNKETCKILAIGCVGMYAFTPTPSYARMAVNGVFAAIFLSLFAAYKYFQYQEEKAAEQIETKLEQAIETPAPSTNSSNN